MKRIIIPIVMALALPGCGLQPLYSGGSQGAVAQTLGGIEVPPIPERAGWLMTNALSDRIAPLASGEAQYRLVVELDDRIEGFGVRADDSVTRERRSLRARYQLVRLSDGAVVLDATAGSDAGVDVVSSEFATVAAEDTALENLSARVADQIVARLSLFARAAAAE